MRFTGLRGRTAVEIALDQTLLALAARPQLEKVIFACFEVEVEQAYRCALSARQ